MRGRGGGPHRGGSNARGKGKPSGQQPQGQQASTTPQGGQPSMSSSSAASQPSLQSKDAMRDRLVFLLAGAAGSQVKVTLKNGHQYVGILASAIIESEFGTILHRVKKIHPPEQDPEIKPTLIFAAKDVKALETVSEIDLCARVEPLPPPVQGANVPLNSSDSFRTDVQITGSAADGSQRVLQSWADDIPLDDNTADLMQSSGSGGKAWDQFAANEKLFGVRSNYNEELYTTKLDRTGKDFKEREKQADKLAKEIMSGTTSNPHMAEERGQQSDGKGLTEEDKYSGVIRGSGAYVPPSARKPSDAPPTSKPAQTSTEPPEKEAVTPAMAVNGKPAEVSIADAAASSKAPPQNVTSAFQSFVKDEKKRLEPKKAAAATKAREDKLAEFKSFSQNFKVGYPMPRDLASMLHVKEQQQKQQSATSSAAASPTPKETKIAPRFASPSPGQVPASKPVKSKAGPDLVEIPSFAELQQRKVAKDLGAKKAEAWVKNNHAAPTTGAPQGAPSTASRFSATAREFKPNPNAISFKPGASVSPARKPAELPGARHPPASPSVPAHPFFGHKLPKKSTANFHVKEDFSPFKNAQVGDPASVPFTWDFTGKTYRQNPATPQSPPQQYSRTPSERANTRSPLSSIPSGAATPVPAFQGPPPASMAFSPGQPPQPMALPPGMQPHMLQPGLPHAYYPGMPPPQLRYPGPGQPQMAIPGSSSVGPGSMPFPPPQQQQQFMGFPPGMQPGVYNPGPPQSFHSPMFSPRQANSMSQGPPQSFYTAPMAGPPQNYRKLSSGPPGVVSPGPNRGSFTPGPPAPAT